LSFKLALHAAYEYFLFQHLWKYRKTYYFFYITPSPMQNSNAENNKRIAKNTLFLYFRSILTLGVRLCL